MACQPYVKGNSPSASINHKSALLKRVPVINSLRHHTLAPTSRISYPPWVIDYSRYTFGRLSDGRKSWDWHEINQLMSMYSCPASCRDWKPRMRIHLPKKRFWRANHWCTCVEDGEVLCLDRHSTSRDTLDVWPVLPLVTQREGE